MERVAVAHLDLLWRHATTRLQQRLVGLTDDEFFWRPTEECWTVHPVRGSDERWTIDYDFPPPIPAPVATIAWRTVHIANGNTIYVEHAFGPGLRTFLDLDPPRTASSAIAHLNSSCETVSAVIERAQDADLAELRPSHLGEPRSAGDVLCILTDEVIHHGAEIGLLRDLYLRRHNLNPNSA